ncbi:MULTISPECIES: MarR family transcriptional regulator [unclassified Streptomyces]|uniref:MarR family transcriptional regulator n=1 Tax=unclassified Streptomyces TaxID=2593676 RepID=UPI0012FEAA50|nr:MarR family transcriptional regulator [Streptomyces sp. NBC_00370]
MERTPGSRAGSIAELRSVLSALAYSLTRTRAHDRLVAMAGMPVDRPGLALLRVLVTEGQPLRVGELADRLDVRHPHVTRQVKELEAQGLVEPVLETGDRRVRRVVPTRRGRDTLLRFDSAFQRLLEESFADVPAEEIDAAANVLRRITGHRERSDPDG